ncbi:phosphoribosyltransferase family protein [Flavobacteriaceae bacterium S356]|uniref:Phosphoribosyltransferase family protein n=1 Tax=Asprobacillus argus TaxID=3076534 RepID=A0ABU3LDT2_9FLAO|nr:phosphoribosyltransferase family protein [Flavobacteriaceae bacterium S356]
MTTKKNVILSSLQIEQKTRRIAYQILESNSKEKEMVIAGINGNGFVFANKLAAILKEISSVELVLCEVYIDKKNPLNEISTSIAPNAYKNRSLVLVDDVLNSGSTLIHGIKHFLEVPLKQFKTAVLVNRNHKKYPVKADFKGLSLSTSIQEHISVEFEKGGAKAYLM